MKKILFFVALATVAVSCQMNEIEKEPTQPTAEIITIGIQTEQPDNQTKTSLDSDYSVLWTAEDRLTVFGSADLTSGAIFTLSEGAGMKTAKFEGEDVEGDKLIAVYPDSYVESGSSITEEGEIYTVSVTIPQIQNYAANSFSDKNLLAVGVGTKESLKMKNVMGLLELGIYTTETTGRSVSQLEITSTENLAGKAEVKFSETGTPELKWVDDTVKAIRLKFAAPVEISTDETSPTKFYVIAPVGAFANGFSFAFRSGSSVFSLKSADADNSIIRSQVRQMPTYRARFTFKSDLILYKPSTVTDYVIKQKVSYGDTTNAERYYHFCVPKADFIKDGAVDSIAIFNYLKDTITSVAKAKMESDPGIYPDFATACDSTLSKKTLIFSNVSYNSLTVLDGIVSFDATNHGLTAISNIRASEVKTLDHVMYDEEGVNFDSGSVAAIAGRYVFAKSSDKAYNPCSYVSYCLTKDSAFEGTASSVKYKALSLTSFKSNVSEDLTSACADKIKEYFKSNGSALSSASLTKFNEGTTVTAGLTGTSAGASYVIMMQVITAANDTSVYVKTLRTMRTSRMWAVPTIAEDYTSFTITAKCKIASGKYYLLTSSNTKTMADISTALDSSESSLSEAQISKLNTYGSLTFKTAAIDPGKGRYVMVRLTNAAGDSFDYAAFAYNPATN